MRKLITIATLIIVAVPLAASAPAGADETVTYTATFTVPAPPASTFSGSSGGGDGWDVALSSTRAYNVFHHDSNLNIYCSSQADGSACWSGDPAPSGFKTITEASTDGGGNPITNSFATAAAPGLHLNQETGHLFVGVTRRSTDPAQNDTAGVACIDTTLPDDTPGDDLLCGFTPLSGVGDAPGTWNRPISNPAMVGSKMYLYNQGSGSNATIRLLCFDTVTESPCPEQPFAVDRGGQGGDGVGWGIASIGGRVYVQVVGGGTNMLSCFDPGTSATCSGSWPVAAPTPAAPPIPLLNANGVATGACVPLSTPSCFGLDGGAAPTPPGMTITQSGDAQWTGPAVTIGARIYVPATSADVVSCYDYGAQEPCANFPKSFDNLLYLYSVSPDPQRPACIWVNADSRLRIQNFDAFTGGPCGTGAIRVLTSSIVVPRDECIPASFTSLQVLSPPRGSYSTGTVDFQDNSGNPIPGAATHSLDGTGTTDLTDLDLSTSTPLPQLLVTLNDAGEVGNVQMKLTWRGRYSEACSSRIVDVRPPATGQGYRLGGLDGGAFAFGTSTFEGSLGNTRLNGRIVHLASTPSGKGYWLLGGDGGVFGFGDAGYHGSAPGVPIAISDAKALIPTSSGKGYWIVKGDGGVLAFGDAGFFGSAPGLRLRVSDVVGGAATPSGRGYWLVKRDGGVLAFGDARFLGSGPGLNLLLGDVVGMAPTPTGLGYWMVKRDGGVLSFGDARFLGAVPGLVKVDNVVGILATPTGDGYWLAQSNGGVFSFGAAAFQGGLALSPLNAPVVAIGR